MLIGRRGLLTGAAALAAYAALPAPEAWAVGARRRRRGVTVAPGSGPIVGTLGVTTGTSNYPSGGNEVNVIPVTSPVGGCYVNKLVVGWKVGTGGAGGASVRGVIYTDNAGVPDARVAFTPDFTTATGETQQDLTFSSAVFLAAGNYWIGVHQSGADDLASLSSGSSTRYATHTFGSGVPAAIGSTTAFGFYVRVSAPYSVT